MLDVRCSREAERKVDTECICLEHNIKNSKRVTIKLVNCVYDVNT